MQRQPDLAVGGRVTVPAAHPDVSPPGLLDARRPDVHCEWRALGSVVYPRAAQRSSAEDRSYYRAFGRWDEPAGMCA